MTHAGAVMLTFGIGAVVPVLLLAYGSRQTLSARGHDLRVIATIGKPAMAVALLVVGALTLSGTDKVVETWIVDHMPDWLVTLTTRF